MDTQAILYTVQNLLRSNPKEAVEVALDALGSGFVSTEQQIEFELAISRGYIHQGQYSNGEPHALTALDLARSGTLRRLEGLALNELGIYRFVENAFDAALYSYMQAMQLLKMYGKPSDVAKVHTNMGNVHSRKREYFEAVCSYEAALDLLNGTEDVVAQAKVLMNLSSLYQYVLYDSDTAIKYTEQAIALFRKLNDSTGLSKALHNYAQFIRRQGKLEASIHVYREALEHRKRFTEPIDLAMNYAGLAGVLIEVGRVEEAERVLTEAHQALVRVSASESAMNTLLMPEAELLSIKGRYDEASAVLKKIKEWASAADLEEVTSALNDLEVKIAIQMGNYQKATETLLHLFDEASEMAQHRAEARLLHVKRQIEQAHAMGLEEAERIRSVELAQTIRRLEALSVENEEYMAFLAHELKNPLSTIRVIGDLLANHKKISEDERQAYGRDVVTIASQMFDMITRVLSGSRTKLIETFSAVDARIPLHHVVSSAKTHALSKGIHLDWSEPSEPVLVNADDGVLHTVFENLVSNAVKYTPSGGVVKVWLRVLEPTGADPVILFSVLDTGPGISDFDKLRLFHAFPNLGTKPTAGESSTGLGLHLVRRSVDQLKGRIWCESEVGRGATFSVELPLYSGSSTL